MAVYRQGDVLLVAIRSIPKRTVRLPRDGDRIVLAYGEVTGHTHAIRERHAELLAASDEEINDRFLRIVGEEARLTHEEHGTIVLPPGNYRVRLQREYQPQMLRRVAD